MKEEYLDIVDENNNLTGEVEKRNKVHAEGIWHRTVHIYLFRRKDETLEFLVHLRSQDKDLNPNKWDTRFGGHIQSGISTENAVEQEIKEEIGLEVDAAFLINGSWCKRDYYPNCELTKVFYLELNEDVNKLKFNDGEVQEVKWLGSNEILEKMKKEPENWTSGVEEFTEIKDELLGKLES